MSANTNEGQAKTRILSKKAYQAPKLVRYGAVRKLTQAAATGNAENSGMSNPFMATSDESLKENVICVGRHSLGFGLYLFNYKAEFRNAYGHGRQFGVMASEVEAIVPAAVSEGPLGHKTVDYAMLGISRVVS